MAVHAEKRLFWAAGARLSCGSRWCGHLHSAFDEQFMTSWVVWVPNRSSTCGDLGIFVDQSDKPVIASEATAG